MKYKYVLRINEQFEIEDEIDYTGWVSSCGTPLEAMSWYQHYVDGFWEDYGHERLYWVLVEHEE